MRTKIEFNGKVHTLDLRPHSVRADRYAVYYSDAAGNLREATPGPVSTLRGVVEEDPGSLVAAGVPPVSCLAAQPRSSRDPWSQKK